MNRLICSAAFALMLLPAPGSAQDFDAATVKWNRLAAEQGNVWAQYLLGSMYYNGDGVPQDDAAAMKWYRLAAEQGHVSA